MTTPLQEKILNDPQAQADLLKQIEHIAASGQSDDFDSDVGPWMQTPLGPKAKAAWERGMSRRKQPSVRDDIDRAMEYAPLIGTAIGGALGARSGVRKARKVLDENPTGHPIALSAMNKRILAGSLGGYAAGVGSEGVARDARDNSKRRK